jgi:hypothetical protein
MAWLRGRRIGLAETPSPGVCSAAWRLGQPLLGDDATHIDVCGLGLGLADLAR